MDGFTRLLHLLCRPPCCHCSIVLPLFQSHNAPCGQHYSNVLCRTALGPMQVLRHLGFQVNEGQDGAERLPRVIFHTAAGIVFGQVSPGIRWGGTSAMSFEVSQYPAI